MKVLLLAGTQEARRLAERLAGDARFDVVASLAGATRAPLTYAVPTRHGGFGGAKGLSEYIENNAVEAVVDATHPFSRIMPVRAQKLCAVRGVAYLRLLRPGWTMRQGDRWHLVDDAAAAAAAVAPGARVFLATGRRSLPGFAPLAVGRHLVVRVTDPPTEPFPFADGEWLVARPPFTEVDEIRTFRDLRIEVLVVKDSGGPGASKLAAARTLGIRVVMLRRPPPPPGDCVGTVENALGWLDLLEQRL